MRSENEWWSLEFLDHKIFNSDITIIKKKMSRQISQCQASQGLIITTEYPNSSAYVDFKQIKIKFYNSYYTML